MCRGHSEVYLVGVIVVCILGRGHNGGSYIEVRHEVWGKCGHRHYICTSTEPSHQAGILCLYTTGYNILSPSYQ